MKKVFFYFISAIMLFALTGCEKLNGGMIVDWTPVSMWIKVQDKAGNDLLDPKNPDNLIDGATVAFRGETYESSRQWYETGRPFEKEPQTKACLAIMYGLYLIDDSILRPDSNGFSLLFGDIDGADDMDEDLVLTLADGTTADIHYHCSKHNERKISCNRYWKINGKKQSSSLITIVVDK